MEKRGERACCTRIWERYGIWEVIALGGNQNDRITFMLETATTKKLVGYNVPNTYLEFSKKEEGLAEYDISELNKEIGYTEYRRK